MVLAFVSFVTYQRIQAVLFAAMEINMFLCTEILREQMETFEKGSDSITLSGLSVKAKNV